ncbi:F420-dependent NADP oxidoreductase [Variovorax sp. WS11]|uniref:NADPH-dependent F420 reductase n=1 Tax=Variovorax sp. WS11 TaxID=1105204 RepID=UPI000D0DFED2|nr:NAD(P)-binding domain-containing protein [Variovorax sp. WS11]NDZ17000.1 NAD(P)-binding domain-containing protein [Variovorax sp. WS11]PSL81391.1 F420-dependent NADP oxidoreductase [Variovorax sp. WS11]
MKIGIVGTGNMGRILGCGWAVHGHEVFFGARDPQTAVDAAELARANGAARAQAGSNREAAVFGDVIFYSVRDVDPTQVIGDISALDGKVVIDPNNWPVPEGKFDFAPIAQSLAERLQAWLPSAQVVKCFNTMAQELFEMPVDELRAQKVSAFIASDHAGARDTVAALTRDLGLAPVDMGPLRNARIVEPLGDVIRYLILGAGLGPYATLKVDVLQPAETGRFGGRHASAWWARNAETAG